MSHRQVQSNVPETALQRALRQAEEETKHREFRIAKEQNTENIGRGDDDKLATGQKTELQAPNAEFSKKIYYFPEEYNALRRELEENWPALFHTPNPEFGFSMAWAMVYDAPHFVGMCNDALDMVVQFDSEAVAKTCKTFLNGFRKLRGVSQL